MKKIISGCFLAGWLSATGIALFLPMPEIDVFEVKITYYDKAIHIVLFGVLAYFLIDFFSYFEKIKFRAAARLSFVISLILILSSEYAQSFIAGRKDDPMDSLAGLLGVLAAISFSFFMRHSPRPKLLLHSCCAVCAAHIAERLKDKYKILFYFYNPNIFPKSEYHRRRREMVKIAKRFNLKLIIGNDERRTWREAVRGHERDQEGGERCSICYRFRLLEAFKFARRNKIHFLATTLTTGPHKKAEIINNIGAELAKKYKINFLAEDFKKKDGFKRAGELAKKFNLYRQNYCGCEYSIRRD